MLVGALAFVLLAVFAVGFFLHRRNSRWEHYLAGLSNEPGIVVTGADRHWGHYWVWGLRDPMSPDPLKLAVDAGIPAEKLNAHFVPYQSLDERFQYSAILKSESKNWKTRQCCFR